MINFTIIIPFSRPHNADAIKATVTRASENLKGKCQLLAVCHRRDHMDLFDNSIFVLMCPDFDPCYWKINCALNQMFNMNERHYVGFMPDDNGYDPEIFSKMEAEAEKTVLPEVMLINSFRHDHCVASHSEFQARPDQMKVGIVSLEQFFVRADIMASHRFINWGGADGRMAETLYSRNPHGFLFLPHLKARFNLLPA